MGELVDSGGSSKLLSGEDVGVSVDKEGIIVGADVGEPEDMVG